MTIAEANHFARAGAARVLAKIPLFDSLTVEDLDAIGRQVIEKKFNRDETVLEEGACNEFMYIVLSGKVKVARYLEGREYIRAIHKKGEWFGEIALLDGKTEPAAVIAMEESRIGLLSRTVFETSFFHDVTRAQQIIRHLCSRLREAWLSMEILNCPNAEMRVRKVLERLALLYGVRDSRGVMIPDRFKHKEIAAIADISRETASRCLSAMKKSGEIEQDEARQIVLLSSFHVN